MSLATDPAQVKPGLLGFFVVAALGLATFLLIRSMRKQLRKIDFEEPRAQGRQAPEQGSGAAAHRDDRDVRG